MEKRPVESIIKTSSPRKSDALQTVIDDVMKRYEITEREAELLFCESAVRLVMKDEFYQQCDHLLEYMLVDVANPAYHHIGGITERLGGTGVNTPKHDTELSHYILKHNIEKTQAQLDVAQKHGFSAEAAAAVIKTQRENLANGTASPNASKQTASIKKKVRGKGK